MTKQLLLIIYIVLSVCAQAQNPIYLSTNSGDLRLFDLESCSVPLIGSPGSLTDIAVTGNGQLWGSYSGNLYSIDTGSGSSTIVQEDIFIGNANNLVDLNDSTLIYTSSMNSGELFKLNLNTLESELIGSINTGLAGDLTWYDDYLYGVTGSYLDTILDSAYSTIVQIELNSDFSAITNLNHFGLLDYHWGFYAAVTVPVEGEINSIIGFKGQNPNQFGIAKICPFDGTVEEICPNINGQFETWGAATQRLPNQYPPPIDCDGNTFVKDAKELRDGELKLYPNPAVNLVRVGSSKHERIRYRFRTLQGHLVFSGISWTNTSIDISHLREGFYQMELISGGNTSYQRLIVQ